MAKKVLLWFLTRLGGLGCGVSVYYFGKSWWTGRSTKELFLEQGWDHHLFIVSMMMIVAALTERALRRKSEAPEPA